MCDNEHKKVQDNCIADILKVIFLLQQSVCESKNNDMCTKEFFGHACCHFYNTRPVMIFTCCSNGVPWSASTNKKCYDKDKLSNVFRIEKLDGNCVTFRVLKEENNDCKSSFIATDSVFTINTNCICAIKCLEDTYIKL